MSRIKLEKDTDKLVWDSYNLIKDLKQKWTKDKQFKYPKTTVQTYHYTTPEKQYWCGRSNSFNGLELYQKFLKYLIGVNPQNEIEDLLSHTRNEKEYIHSLIEFEQLPCEFENYILVKLIYDIGSLFKKREFTEYIHIVPPKSHSHFGGDPDEEISFVISVPGEPGLATDTVKALYYSVEIVVYNRETHDIQWEMITSSDAKGSLPFWLQKLGINKSISEDVPSFLAYIEKQM